MKKQMNASQTSTGQIDSGTVETLLLSCSPLAQLILSLHCNPNGKDVFDWTMEDFNDWNDEFELTGKTAGKIIAEEMKKRHWNLPIFIQKTGFSKTVYKDLQNPASNHELRTTVTMCVALEFGFNTSLRLLMKQGCTFERAEHRAYVLLLFQCRGKSVRQCNEKLDEWGIDQKYFLGGGYLTSSK